MRIPSIVFTKSFFSASMLFCSAAMADPAIYEGSIYDLDPVSTQSVGGDRVLEQSIGTDDMQLVNELGENDVFRRTAKPVGRLTFSTTRNRTRRVGHCTASLIADDLILTNKHCVPKGEAQLYMGYLKARSRLGVASYPVDPNPVEVGDKLDYAILKVLSGDPGREWGIVEFSAAVPDSNSSLFVVHHPRGFAQHITRGRCQSSDPATDGSDLLHLCDTEGGSSGAPIFDAADRKVVGLHYAAISREDLNAGVQIASIAEVSEIIGGLVAKEEERLVVPIGPKPVSDPDPELSVELEYWHLCRDNEVAAYCEAYLEDYSSGKYKRLASIRLEELRAAASVKASAAAEAEREAEARRVAAAAEQRREEEAARRKAEADRLARESDPCFGVSLPRGTTCESDGRGGYIFLLTAEEQSRLDRAAEEARIAAAQAASRQALLSSSSTAPSSRSTGSSSSLIRGSVPGSVFTEFRGGPEMVVIPSGRFKQGSPAGEARRYDNEGPQREVRIPNPFALSKTEVTFSEWDACVAGGGCQSNRSPDDRGWGRGSRPVIKVSWDDAQEYVAWLNSRVSGSPYRLPSESEWEYAARGGTTTPFWTGGTISTDQANYNGDYTYGNGRKGVYRGKTVPVGSLNSPNPFGLHDMLGNVWEWTEDCWHGGYSGAPRNGSAWLISSGGDCDQRVLRGGSWINLPRHLRAAYRVRSGSSARYDSFGFRVARTLMR